MNLSEQVLNRSFTVDRSAIDKSNRTCELSFSSEEPYQRWFGIEILDHNTESVNLNRLNSGGALLMDHDPKDQIGVVENVAIGADRKARAKVRFGNSARAKEIFDDVSTGIRTNVSVGYQIDEWEVEKKSDTPKEPDTYRVKKWTPFEISIVAIPADSTVGVGRSAKPQKPNSNLEVKTMNKESINTEQVKDNSEIDSMLSIAKETDSYDLMQEVVKRNGTLQELNTLILGRLKEKNSKSTVYFDENGKPRGHKRHTFSAPTSDTNESYSLVNVIRSLSGDKNVDIGYEVEMSQEMCKARGKKSEGFSIPMSAISKRAAVDAASIGSSLVETSYRPDMMIEFLRNKSVVVNSGIQTIQVGQGGDIIIPRQTGTASAEWLTLDGVDDISESNQTFDQVELQMRTLTAMTTYTHKMLKQGLPNIEQIIRSDLAQMFATELDKTAINGALANSKIPTGILNQPGIEALTAAGSVPTFGELVQMEGLIAENNVDTRGMRYITTPTLGTTLKATEKAPSTAQYIWTDRGEGEGLVNGYGAAYSSNMPNGTILLGQFSDFLMAYWGSIDIMVDPYGTNFSKGNVTVRAMIDVDMNIRRPDSFCKLEVA